MKPIINPWIFYWAEVSETMKIVSLLLLVAIIIGGVIIFMIYGSDIDFENETENRKFFKRLRLTIVMALFFLICTIIIPSEETIYKMTIASYVTEDNYHKGKKEVKELIDYICDKIKEINTDEKNNNDM